jgi:hypothetical protein
MAPIPPRPDAQFELSAESSVASPDELGAFYAST